MSFYVMATVPQQPCGSTSSARLPPGGSRARSIPRSTRGTSWRRRSCGSSLSTDTYLDSLQAARRRLGKRVPALVWSTGGGRPDAQGLQRGHPYLVNRGYAVLGINNRAAPGTEELLQGDDLSTQGASLECVEGRSTWRASRTRSGPHRDIGAATGGYRCWRPRVQAAGVRRRRRHLRGLERLRTIESIPKWWESFRSRSTRRGRPVKDREISGDLAPVPRREIRGRSCGPGANDPRVLKAESDDIVAAAKKNGVPVEYVASPEGHGFTTGDDITAWRSIGTSSTSTSGRLPRRARRPRRDLPRLGRRALSPPARSPRESRRRGRSSRRRARGARKHGITTSPRRGGRGPGRR